MYLKNSGYIFGFCSYDITLRHTSNMENFAGKEFKKMNVVFLVL